MKAIQILYDSREAASLIASNIEDSTGRGYKNKLKRALAKELERRLRDGSLDLCIGNGRTMMLEHTQFTGIAPHGMSGGVFGASVAARLAGGAAANAMLAHAILQQQQQHAAGLGMPHGGLVPGPPLAPGHWTSLGWNHGAAGGGSAAGVEQQQLQQQQAQRIEQFHRAALLGRQQQQQQQQQQRVFQQQRMLAQQRHAHAAAAGNSTTAPLVFASQPGGSFAAPGSAGVGGAPSGSAPWALSAHTLQQVELERLQGAEVAELCRKHAQQKEQLAACQGNELHSFRQRQLLLATMAGTGALAAVGGGTVSQHPVPAAKTREGTPPLHGPAAKRPKLEATQGVV